MPSRHKQRAAYADDYFYDQDRDVRSDTRSYLRDRSERVKYGNYKYIKPSQINEIRHDPNPQSSSRSGPWEGEVKWSSHRSNDDGEPRERWTKRSLYNEAKRCSKFDMGCTCCWCSYPQVLRKKEARQIDNYHNSRNGGVIKTREFDDGENDARESRRTASWSDNRPSRAEDSIAWTLHNHDQSVVDDMVRRAASDYERRKDRRIQSEWTVLRGRRGSSSRSNDDWEVLSNRSWS